MRPRFFCDAAAFRRWLEHNHRSAAELWVGFHKKSSGKRSITWPESVDQALCFGWIDGVRRGIDESSYMIRFTPRKPRSSWSAVNLRRARALKEQGLLRPAGLAAFEARDEARSERRSYERENAALAEPYLATFRRNRKAWTFFESQPPGYRKTASWWVMSAKMEETRLRRLGTLIKDSANGLRIGLLRR